MTQRVDFSLQTNLGNVADPVNAQDTATKNYVDSRPAGSSVSVNGTTITNPNLQNNALALGVDWTVAGSNITGGIRLVDVATVADAEIATRIGSQAGATFISNDATVVLVGGATGAVTVAISVSNASALANTLTAGGPLYGFIGTTANGLPDLQVLSYAAQGIANINLIVTLASSVTLAQAQTFFANVQSRTIYVGSSVAAGNFVFQADPAAAITTLDYQWAKTNLLATGALTKTFNDVAQTITLNGGSAGPGIFNIGTSYISDNTGILTKTLSSTASLSNVTGSVATNTDYGAVNITTTPWPPVIPAGFNNFFIGISSADNATWGGVGAIQNSPAGITTIAWIKAPPGNISFTDAKLWFLYDAVATGFVGTTQALAQANPVTTTIWPELQLAYSSDGYGNAQVTALTQPFTEQIVANRIGSVTLTRFATSSPTTPSATTIQILQGDIPNATLDTLINKYLWSAGNGTATPTLFTGYTNSGLFSILTVGSSTGFAGVSAIYASTNNYMSFEPSVINGIKQNAVSSLNSLKGDVSLLAGTGIGISTGSNALTITNTQAGVSASNFTSFVTSGGPSIGSGIVGFVTTNRPSFEVACFGFGLQADTSPIDGGYIGPTQYINTTQTAVSPYGFALLFPIATTYTTLEVLVYSPNYTFNFSATGASGPGVFSLDNVLFSKASSSAASPPDLRANIFPAFAQTSPGSDDVQLNALLDSYVTVTDQGGGNYRATVIGGIYSGIVNSFTNTVANTTIPYLGWQRLVAPAGVNITGISNLTLDPVIVGGVRVLVAIPGAGGATPTWNQTMGIGNSTNLPLVLQDVATTPKALTLRSPAAYTNNYALTWPADMPANSFSSLISDTSGNLTWRVGNLQNTLTTGNSSANVDLILTGSGKLATTSGLVLNGSTSGSVILSAPATVTTYTLKMPAAQGGANQVLTNDGSGNLSWATPTPATTPGLAQVLAVGNSSGPGTQILFQDSGTTPKSVSLAAPSVVSTAYSLRLPSAQGAASTVLTNDGSGNLSWTAASGVQYDTPIPTATAYSTSVNQVLGDTTVQIAANASFTFSVGAFIAFSNSISAQTYRITAVANGAGPITILTFTPGLAVAVASGTTIYLATTNFQGAINALVVGANLLGNYSPTLRELRIDAIAGVGNSGNTQYLYNNNGAISGNAALTFDSTNSRVSTLAPVAQSNLARLADVQAATAGIKPVNPPNSVVHIAETNVVGVYTNNTGVGTAVLSDTSTLTLAGVTPAAGDYVLLASQSAGLENGSYQVTLNVVSGYNQIVFTFGTPGAQAVTGPITVQYTFTGITQAPSPTIIFTIAVGQTVTAGFAATASVTSSWRIVYLPANPNGFLLISTDPGNRWSSTPVLFASASGGTFNTGGSSATLIAFQSPAYRLQRTNIVPTFGNFWLANNVASSNYGVQYENTTTGTITVGTTAIVYTKFGVSNAVPTLQTVTQQGNTSSRPIVVAPLTTGYSLTLSADSSSAIVRAQFSDGTSNAPLSLAAGNSNSPIQLGVQNYNYAQVVGGNSVGAPVTISATGGDPAAPLRISPNTSGYLDLGNTAQYSGLRIGGHIATSYVQLVATGVDTDIDIILKPKNAGNLYPLGASLDATLSNQPQIYVADSINSTSVGPGNVGQVLASNGSNSSPYWANVGTAPKATIFRYGLAQTISGAVGNFPSSNFTNEVNGLNLTISNNGWIVPANSGRLSVKFAFNVSQASGSPYELYIAVSTLTTISTNIVYGTGAAGGISVPSSAGFISSATGGTPASTTIIKNYGSGDYFWVYGEGDLANSTSTQTITATFYQNSGGSLTISNGSYIKLVTQAF